jgi:hypothetical protein
MERRRRGRGVMGPSAQFSLFFFAFNPFFPEGQKLSLSLTGEGE